MSEAILLRPPTTTGLEHLVRMVVGAWIRRISPGGYHPPLGTYAFSLQLLRRGGFGYNLLSDGGCRGARWSQSGC